MREVPFSRTKKKQPPANFQVGNSTLGARAPPEHSIVL
jgi:hypothetical protein